MAQENATVKQARKLSFVAIKNGKIDTYRSVVNKVKNVATIDGTKRGANLNLYTRFISDEAGNVIGQVFCNRPLSQDQADTHFATLAK